MNNPTSLSFFFFFFFFNRDEVQHIKLPKDIEDAKALGRVLSRYNEKYFYTVTAGFFTTYILYPLIGKSVELIYNPKGEFWYSVG